MSPLNLQLTLFVFGFPLLLIVLQWIFTKFRLPWIGLLVGLVSVLAFWLIIIQVYTPKPGDCRQNACEWAGVGLLFTTIYGILVAIISTGIGFAIKFIYRKWVWKTGEIIHQTGKIPALILMGVFILYIILFTLAISGLLNHLIYPFNYQVYP